MTNTFMKKSGYILFFLFVFSNNPVKGQQPTIIAEYTAFNTRANIQFFYGDYFYYSDNNSFSGNYLRRFNLDTKKDSIIQNLNFGCFVAPNYYYCDCIAQGSVVVGGNAYILAGSAFRKFDLSNYSWTTLQSYPSIYTKNRAAIVSDGGNYIYVWGGFVDPCQNPVFSNELWRYDIVNDTWFMLSTAPSSAAGKNATFKFPFIYFAGGNECWNPIHTFNVLNNSWATIPSPPFPGLPNVCNAVQYERIFSDNGELYCLDNGIFNGDPLNLFRYDEINQVWVPLQVSNFLTQLNPGPSPISNNWQLESFYKRGDIIWFTCDVEGLYPMPASQSDGQLNALSLKRQINLIIDSTSCYLPADDSLEIYYRIEYSGAFLASNTIVYLEDSSGQNSFPIFSNSNFYSSGQNVSLKSKKIHKSFLNYNLRATNYQANDSIWSTNKFPVSYRLRNKPTGSISPAGAVYFCPGQPVGVVLNANSSNSVSYQWYLNGISLTGQTSAATTATQLGAYFAVLFSNNGCSNNTDTVLVQNAPVPNGNISAVSTTNICQGQTVELSATQVIGNTYQWQLNNININNANSSSYFASASGTYRVLITNLYGCTTISNSITVVVNPLPVISVSATPASICLGSASTLMANSCANSTWFPGNFLGCPSVSPNNTTTYTVVVTDVNGCSNSATQVITVNPLPIITTSATSDTICSGSATILFATGGSNYIWMPGNLAGNPTVSPPTTTTYTVSGTDVNGCSSTATKIISVNGNPTPVVSTSATPATICSGASSTLSATGGTSYSWMPGNLTGSPSVSPAVTTTYTVTATNASGCSNTATVTVNVNATPVVTTSATPATICSGASSTLSATGGTSYSWMPGNLTGSPSVSPITTTTYTVTATNASGCSNTATVTVNVNPTPNVTAIVVPDSICAGGTGNLSAIGASSYTWQPGSFSGSSVTVSPAATTSYTVLGIGANGCSAQATVALQVIPLPVITQSPSSQTVSIGSTVQFMVVSANPAVNYQWQVNNGIGFLNINNGGQYNGANNDTLIVSNLTSLNNNQTYRCVITYLGCTDTSGVADLKVAVAAGDMLLNYSDLPILIFPNPSSDGLHIQCEEALLGSRYFLRDASGRTCLAGLITRNETILRMGHLAAGVYVMYVHTKKGNLVRRIQLLD